MVFRKVIPLLLVVGFLCVQKASSQTVYQDSIRTSFSVNSSFTRSLNYNTFGVGGNVSFENGISIGLLGAKYNELSKQRERPDRNGIGWGGYFSLMLADELKGSALGIEVGFIYNRQKYIEESVYYKKPYKLVISSFGTGISFSKRIEEKDNSFLLPYAGFNFMPITKGEETDERYTESVAFKYSVASLGLGYIKHEEEYSWIIDTGASLNLSSATFSVAVGLTFLF